MSPAEQERLLYAFGHMVSSFDTHAHSAASGELADDVLRDELGMTDGDIAIIEVLAEYVNDNYQWTGEAEAFARRVARGEA